MTKKLKNYEVLVRALNNFSLVNLDVNVLRKGENVFKKIKESMASGWPVPCLSFIEENDEPFTLQTENDSKNWDGTLEYSIDTKNWSEWDGTEINSSDDGKLYLRGTGNSNVTSYGNSCFVLTDEKRIQCLGNIEALLDYKTVGAGRHPKMGNNCYNNMFYNCASLTQAPELPAITLTDRCYKDMFYACSSLAQAPELPATTLAHECYNTMFYNCTSLTAAPELPATTLAESCYEGMFEGCASLIKTPKLPAATLELHCYYAMFRDCSSLTQAPDLPATTLANACYNSMFEGCASLAGAIHCPASTANDANRPDADANIPAGTAIVVYDL
jgi:hypothetical protein